MTCVHLKKLYQLCQDEGLRVSSTYLIHFTCDQCNVKEVCPSTIVDLPDNDEDTLEAANKSAESIARDHSPSD